MKVLDIPAEVIEACEIWAMVFEMAQPDWRDSDQEYDLWGTDGGYDLNLYACEGDLSITAYLLVDDGTGHKTTDTSTYKTVVRR